MKLARKWGYQKKKIPTGQAGVVFAEGNFWGRTLAAISSSCDPNSYREFEPLMPGYHKVPYSNLEKLEVSIKVFNLKYFQVTKFSFSGTDCAMPPEHLFEKIFCARSKQ